MLGFESLKVVLSLILFHFQWKLVGRQRLPLSSNWKISVVLSLVEQAVKKKNKAKIDNKLFFNVVVRFILSCTLFFE